MPPPLCPLHAPPTLRYGCITRISLPLVCLARHGQDLLAQSVIISRYNRDRALLSSLCVSSHPVSRSVARLRQYYNMKEMSRLRSPQASSFSVP